MADEHDVRHVSSLKAQCSVQQDRSPSPSPSHESTSQSINHPLDLKGSSSPQPGGSDSRNPSHELKTSNQSLDHLVEFKVCSNLLHPGGSNSLNPSLEFKKSNQSLDHLLEFKESRKKCILSLFGSVQQGRSASPSPSHESMRSNQSINHPLDLKRSSDFLHPGGSDSLNPSEELKTCNQSLDHLLEFRNELPLDEIYTELYITEGDSGDVNTEHESRQFETQFRRLLAEDKPIKCNDIFKPEQDKPIRSVLTKGIAGIGKTISVQKFILDWAEEKENQDIHLIFPLPFRELNLMKDQKLSLKDLLHIFFPETQEMEIFSDEYKMLFIFDGLDECRLSLDFHSSVRLCDGNESVSVDVLLINLIKRNLLSSALIWITSRPAAADLIPSVCFDRVTEVRGFSDPQKEEYFRKRISDESLSNRIISHLKSSRSLYIMCHIPVFCWISATVLQRLLSETESEEIPKTLTQMYTHFLIIQISSKNRRDFKNKVKCEEIIHKLGKLAFEQLVKGNLIFYEEDLRQCNIDVQEASEFSALCTQIFREESGMFQGKAYCFVHLSVQEHLAALYVYLSCMNDGINVLNQTSGLTSIMDCRRLPVSVLGLHQKAVRKALQSPNGHLDLFLRFFMGFSLKSNQTLLKNLFTEPERLSYSKEDIARFIKLKIKKNTSPEKSINLFFCLNELNDHHVVQEVQNYLKSGSVINKNLSPLKWSAVVFVLLTSGQNLDLFDLNNYVEKHTTANEVLQRLRPVIEKSRTARLCEHNLLQKDYDTLVSVLTSKTSCLRELILTKSNVQDTGLWHLCQGLANTQCKLEALSLESCSISERGCASLASSLRLNPSHLRELDLSGNTVRNCGVTLLFTELGNPACQLKKLLMRNCGFTDEGCAVLASALRSNPSHLKELNLSKNKIRDSGVKLLSDALGTPDCKLEILLLMDCGITHEGCSSLASALKSNLSHLRELDLSANNLTNTGVRNLSVDLEASACNLEVLSLENCDVTGEGCAALASALKTNPSHLKWLNLGWNKIGDSGVQSLFSALENPDCKLEVLRLRDCKITDEGYVALASTLRSNPSHLKELDLSQNILRNPGIRQLCTVLENPDCKLETLRLEYCGIADEGCAALASALKSNPSHLRELDLYMNRFGTSGEQLLSAMRDDPYYKLETIKCGQTHYS